MKFKIEQLFTYGWDDASFGTFDSVADARDELDITLSDMKQAVQAGYMEDMPGRDAFRIVPFKHKDTRRARKEQEYDDQ